MKLIGRSLMSLFFSFVLCILLISSAFALTWQINVTGGPNKTPVEQAKVNVSLGSTYEGASDINKTLYTNAQGQVSFDSSQDYFAYKLSVSKSGYSSYFYPSQYNTIYPFKWNNNKYVANINLIISAAAQPLPAKRTVYPALP